MSTPKDSLEKLMPRCKVKDTDDFPELEHKDDSARCWNCRVWEAIDSHSLQERKKGVRDGYNYALTDVDLATDYKDAYRRVSEGHQRATERVKE
jgi:hypothetical protein